VYALRLRLVFRGGIMEAAFKAFVPASLLFALAQVSDFLVITSVIPDFGETDFLELSFAVSLFVGFYLFSRAWTIRPRKVVNQYQPEPARNEPQRTAELLVAPGETQHELHQRKSTDSARIQ
jgi:hypothetical protein